MDLRDWLIIVGVVALIGILFDGIRRMRNRNKIRLEIDQQYADFPEEDFSAELPNGGARRVTQTPSESVPASSEETPEAGLKVTAEPPPKPLAEERSATVDGDVDLLLDGGLKGVGEGADHWLSSDAPTIDGLSQPRAADRDSGSDERLTAAKDHEVDLLADDPAIGSPPSDPMPLSPVAEQTPADSPASIDYQAVDDGVLGPARVKAQSDVPEADSGQEAAEGTPAAVVEQPSVALVEERDETALDLNQPVTVLMDQLKGGAAASPPVKPVAVPESELEPGLETVSEGAAPAAQPEVAESACEEAAMERVTASREEQDEMDAIEAELSGLGEIRAEEAELHNQAVGKKSEPEPEKPKPVKKSPMRRLREEIQTSFFDMDPELAPEPDPDAEPKPKKKRSRRLAKKTAAKAEVAREEAQQASDTKEPPEAAPVLVINVSGRQPFRGALLFKLVEACGMEFGEMDIFHRHEDGLHQGAVQFSMVNAIKPGHFDMAQRDTFTTPAVTFFLEMSQPRQLMEAFECMLATAKAVADNLDGVLKDENRSVMRPQTIEHYRQQVRDYERRRLAKRA